jgi:hypothetical protein
VRAQAEPSQHAVRGATAWAHDSPDEEEHWGLDYYVDHGDTAYHLLRWDSSTSMHSSHGSLTPLLRNLRDEN